MDPIPVKYCRGEEPFSMEGCALPLALVDFWAWAYSDVLSNTERGVLAEFLVAAALGIDLKTPRSAWSKFDLLYRDKGIEVKSASYHQRWHQERMSNIAFNIPARRAWDEGTNVQDKDPKRHAFLYILCLLAEQERTLVNPLNLDQWRFWVVPTRFFDERKRSQHSITLASLLRERGDSIPFNEIKSNVNTLID